MDIYLRPLVIEDAKVSYRWRNNPEIWKFTGSRPDRKVTLVIEQEWLRRVLSRNDEKRYAICLKQGDVYIGNVQLTGIIDGEAEFHIFIGEAEYWGKGIATRATKRLLEISRQISGLKRIYLFVKKENIPAFEVYQRCGFKVLNEDSENFKMSINLNQ